MLLHLAEIASRGEKDAEHLGLLVVEGAELTWRNTPASSRAAGGAPQPNDRKLITAHRAVARCAVLNSLLRPARPLRHTTPASLVKSEPTRTCA